MINYRNEFTITPNAKKKDDKGIFGGIFKKKESDGDNSRYNAGDIAETGSVMSGGFGPNGDTVNPLKLRLTKQASSSSGEPSGDQYSKVAGKIWMEGYLTKRGIQKSGLNSVPWDRRYFVLKGSNLYYYMSREIFEGDPSKTVKNRPVELLGYRCQRLNGAEPPFILDLLPDEEGDDRRAWQFKCDSLHEMDSWIEAIDHVTGYKRSPT